MKKRYTLHKYIIHMIGASAALSFGAGIIYLPILNIIFAAGSWGLVIGLMMSVYSIIPGFISGLVSSLLLSVFALMFFNPRSISNQKFKILSYTIVSIIGYLTFFYLRERIFYEFGFNTLKITSSILASFVIVFAQYFANENLAMEIENHKVK